MIQLWPHQQEMKKALYFFWKHKGKHAISCAPPRSGKTYVFSSIAKDFVDNGKRIMILSDREELVDQIGGSLKNVGVDPFFIMAGCNVYNDNFNCFVAMSQTLKQDSRKSDYWMDFYKSCDGLLIDECHEQIFNFIFESGIFDDKFVAGFTGTPARRGKMRQLAFDYETIQQTVKPSYLLAENKIVQADIFAFKAPETSKVGINPLTGDYKPGELFSKFDSRVLYSGIVKNYKKYCDNTKFMCYCVSKEHAIKTAIEFHENGYNVKFIVSGTSQPKPPEDLTNEGKMTAYNENLRKFELYQKWFPILSGNRKQLFKDFHESKILGLINVDIATKGYDCPTMETVILNYKTTSLTRYLQSAMRGATYCEGKTHYNLLDFGGNVSHFGNPLEDRMYNLLHEEKKGEGLPPIKNCGHDSKGKPIENEGKTGCKRLMHASLMICPHPDCGFKYPKKEVEEIELEILVQQNSKVKALKGKSFRSMTIDELNDYYKAKKHKPAWLWRQLWYRGQEKEINAFAAKFGWQEKTINTAVKYCINNKI